MTLIPGFTIPDLEAACIAKHGRCCITDNVFSVAAPRAVPLPEWLFGTGRVTQGVRSGHPAHTVGEACTGR
jgi:hypothetical protein